MKYDYLLFFVFFIYYVVTCSKWMKKSSTANLLTAAYEYGFPEPPGYPIVTSAHRVLYLIFSPTVTIKIANGISAAFSAASVVFVSKLITVVTESESVGLLCSVVKGCLPLVQEGGNSAGVFPLQGVILSSLLYAYALHCQSHLQYSQYKTLVTTRGWEAYRVYFCIGMALTNHPIGFVFAAPVLFDLLMKEGLNGMYWILLPLPVYLLNLFSITYQGSRVV